MARTEKQMTRKGASLAQQAKDGKEIPKKREITETTKLKSDFMKVR